MIRLFNMKDYDEVFQLWKKTPGVGLRSIDDSKEGIARFLTRNPSTNFVSVEEGKITGVILGGHDGRRGFIYHTCIDEYYRRRSIGRKLVEEVVRAMKAEGITKLALVAFKRNTTADQFWRQMGFNTREDLNYYVASLDENNI